MEEPSRLLVVDGAHMSQGLASTLEAQGYKTETASTGVEGLDKARTTFPDLVLLDVRLPDMAGLDLVSPLREMNPDMVVILVSDHISAEAAVRALNEDVSAYIPKPLDVDHVLDVVQTALEKQSLTQEGRQSYWAARQELTDRKRAEETLQRRNRELGLLHRASQVLNSTLELDQVLTHLLEEVRRLLGVVACSIWLTDPETGELVCQQASGPQSEIVRGWRLAPGEGFVGRVAQTGESMVVPDTWTNDRHFPGVDLRTGLLLRSIVSVPLLVREKVVGVLQVLDAQTDRFDVSHLTLLEPLAASAAIAIDNAALVETLRQQTIELQQRNEELDAFAHTAAHDLKGTLGYIVPLAQKLAEEHAQMTNEDLSSYLLKIARSGRKMADIIEAMLLLAIAHKLGGVDMTPLDMSGILDDVQDRLDHVIEEVQAEIILPDVWPSALGYAPWVEEIWFNYLSNALKYSGRPAEGVPPRIELGFDEPVTASPDADATIRFWIRDNGPGMTVEEQARLFTPCTRMDQVRYKGHGLGLSIVRRIANKLGSDLGVESEVGRGSLFSFTLPSASGQPGDKANSPVSFQ